MESKDCIRELTDFMERLVGSGCVFTVPSSDELGKRDASSGTLNDKSFFVPIFVPLGKPSVYAGFNIYWNNGTITLNRDK